MAIEGHINTETDTFEKLKLSASNHSTFGEEDDVDVDDDSFKFTRKVSLTN